MREDIARGLEPASPLQPGVPELIVDLALLLVGEDLVGLVARPEFALRGRVPGVAVGVVLQGLALVSLAYLLHGRGSLDGEDLVVIALFRHTA